MQLSATEEKGGRDALVTLGWAGGRTEREGRQEEHTVTVTCVPRGQMDPYQRWPWLLDCEATFSESPNIASDDS